jgi:hypothetical protein
MRARGSVNSKTPRKILAEYSLRHIIGKAFLAQRQVPLLDIKMSSLDKRPIPEALDAGVATNTNYRSLDDSLFSCFLYFEYLN